MHHLYDTEGNIVFSADIGDTTPQHALQETLQHYLRQNDLQAENLHLKDAHFHGFHFDNLTLRNCIFENLTFTEAHAASSWRLQHCKLRNCDFEGDALFRGSLFDCDLTDVDFTRITVMSNFGDSRLRNVQFDLGPDTDLHSSFLGSTLDDVQFVGANIPKKDNIYSRLHTEILKSGKTNPRHVLPWMYNMLTAIMGTEWTEMAERYTIHHAMQLLLYANSDDKTFFSYSNHPSYLVNQIREKAEKEGFKT